MDPVLGWRALDGNIEDGAGRLRPVHGRLVGLQVLDRDEQVVELVLEARGLALETAAAAREMGVAV